jgi:magnesium chelatase family protein
VQRYRDRLSGSLLDRIDLLVEVSQSSNALFGTRQQSDDESSASIRERVVRARQRQLSRQAYPTRNSAARAS